MNDQMPCEGDNEGEGEGGSAHPKSPGQNVLDRGKVTIARAASGLPVHIAPGYQWLSGQTDVSLNVLANFASFLLCNGGVLLF